MGIQTYKKNDLLTLKWKKDVFFESQWLWKFINRIMKQGHQEMAEAHVWKALTIIQKQLKTEPFLVFCEAIQLVRPVVGLVRKRVGKKFHQIPIPLKYPKADKIALRWILDGINKRPERAISERIANEFISLVSDKRSSTIKKRNEFYETVTYNRTYLHFRWV